jgi:hypothetical protein
VVERDAASLSREKALELAVELERGQAHRGTPWVDPTIPL